MLARRITAGQKILNPDVIGALAEDAINQLIRDMVAPARVSSGTIVPPKTRNRETLQADTIIWTPMPLPALYEFGDGSLRKRPGHYQSKMTLVEFLVDTRQHMFGHGKDQSLNPHGPKALRP